MGTIEKFEDIEARQKSRELINDVYHRTGVNSFGKDYGLAGRIRRSAVSIMANMVEGFDRRSNQEFANFLNYSHGSAAEVQSHLYIALVQKYIDKQNFNKVYKKCDEVSRMLLSFSNYLRKN